MSRFQCRVVCLVLAALLLITPTLEAGRGHCRRGVGEAAAVAFAVGAVATLLTPPRPPRVIHHHNFPPRPYPYGYHYPPPIVHREYHFVNPPAPVYVPPAQPRYQSFAPQPVRPAQPATPTLPPTSGPAQTIVSPPNPGTIVDHLPVDAYRSVRNGVTYFVSGNTYYLPIRAGNVDQFVVVQPR